MQILVTPIIDQIMFDLRDVLLYQFPINIRNKLSLQGFYSIFKFIDSPKPLNFENSN